MHQVQLLQNIFHRFFPKKYQISKSFPDFENLDSDQRKKLSKESLYKGEVLLLKGDLSALRFFEAASNLDSSNPEIWYRQGIAFYKYGSCKGRREKGLLLASKNFKFALNLEPQMFEAWFAWAKVLFELGKLHDEYHFFLEANEKFKKAIFTCIGQPNDILAKLHWDHARLQTYIADFSGEAVDVKMAIQSFHKSKSFHAHSSPSFWTDFGNAHLQMALLINDYRLILQGIEHFKHSISEDPEFFEGLASYADALTEFYIYTKNEEYFSKAHDAYHKALKHDPKDYELWLNWAQLLGESGKLNRDPKKLRLSIEKCIKAYRLDSKEPLVIGQWVESLSLLGAFLGRLDLILEAENKIIKATDLYPDDSDLWYSYGVCLSAFGHYYDDTEYYDLAIEKVQEGLSLDRTNAELWHLLALYHYKIGEMTDDTEILERACRFFKRSLDLKPACPTLIYDYAKNLLKLGELNNNQKDIELSVYHLESILRNHKNTVLHRPEWLFSYASALDLLGDFSEEHYSRAVEIFMNVLLIDPDFPEIHFHVALSYAHLAEFSMEADAFHRALRYFRLAAVKNHENEEVWLEWGLALINLALHSYTPDSTSQYYRDAEQKLIQAGKLGNQQAYYYLACLYSLTNKVNESMYFIQKGRDLKALPPIDEILDDEWLENLRSTEAFSHFLYHLESKQNLTDEY